MKRRQKILAVLLSFSLVLGMCGSGFAMQDVQAEEISAVETEQSKDGTEENISELMNEAEAQTSGEVSDSDAEEEKELQVQDTETTLEKAKECLDEADLFVDDDEYWKNDTAYCEINTKHELAVEVPEVSDAYKLEYKWYDKNNTLLNETNPSLEIMLNINNATAKYICRVALVDVSSGEVVYSKDYTFEMIGTSLSVSIKVKIDGEEIKKYGYFDVKTGSDVTIEAIASSVTDNDIQYKWYTETYDEDNGEYVNNVLGTENSYTFTVEDSDEKWIEIYYEISDGYDTESDSITFANESKGTQRAIDATWWINDEETDEVDCKKSGDTYKLKADAKSNTGEKLTYQWEVWNEETREYETVVGETSPTYNVTKGNGDEKFFCTVSDESGNEIGTRFDLYAKSMTITSDIKDSFGNSGEYENAGDFLEGETLTLSVDVTSTYSQDGVKYRWYKHTGYDEETDEELSVELGTGNKLTVVNEGNIEDYECIYCEITDGFQSDYEVFYLGLTTIQLNKALMNKIQTRKITCPNGEKVTLSVDAESVSGGKLTYQWYVPNEAIGDPKLKNGKTKTYTVTRGTQDADDIEFYSCKISDGTTTRNVHFQLGIGETEIEETCSHTYTTDITKATISKDGSITKRCTKCGYVQSTTPISRPVTVALSQTSYTYNGKVQTPTVTVTGADGQRISSANYNVAYSSGRKNVGQYTVKVVFKGNYSGSVSKTFTINPKSTSISKVKAGKKMITVKWKKASKQVSGYRVQYSTDKNFKKGVKNVTVKKYKTTSKSIKKLKSKKTYYVRICTYQKVNGKTYYSSWSKTKKVKVK